MNTNFKLKEKRLSQQFLLRIFYFSSSFYISPVNHPWACNTRFKPSVQPKEFLAFVPYITVNTMKMLNTSSFLFFAGGVGGRWWWWLSAFSVKLGFQLQILCMLTCISCLVWLIGKWCIFQSVILLDDDDKMMMIKSKNKSLYRTFKSKKRHEYNAAEKHKSWDFEHDGSTLEVSNWKHYSLIKDK